MKKKFEVTDPASWLGPDALRLWASSYTMDEHQAFVVAYRALGGRVPFDGVHLRFQRSGFRRSGQGVIPRRWLNPFSVPDERPQPTYHPKILLSEGPGGHALIVSTGNLAYDDLWRTRNLGVRLELRSTLAKTVAKWIERPPKGHRALCLLVGQAGVTLRKPKGNVATLGQFAAEMERCPACRKTARSAGQWVVAAPFWSPGALKKMADLEPDGTVEAYFRARAVWDLVAARARQGSNPVRLDRVTAYELRLTGELPRWHHKVVGWRCCKGHQARSALYLGSANATMCGFFGCGRRAVNWEAGAIWTGGNPVWEQARALARAGYAAVRLPTPDDRTGTGIELDDELGATDASDIERMFSAHLERRIRVHRRARTIAMIGGADLVRVLGRTWRMEKVRLRFEDRNAIEDGGALTSGKKIPIPPGTRPQVHAVFRLELPANMTSDPDVPSYAETTIDVVDLDPEPDLPPPTRRSAIAAALAGLSGAEWGEGSGRGGKQAGPAGAGLREDVRFPFDELLALARRRPQAAAAWLDRVSGGSERALDPLPKFWPRLAAMLGEKGIS